MILHSRFTNLCAESHLLKFLSDRVHRRLEFFLIILHLKRIDKLFINHFLLSCLLIGNGDLIEVLLLLCLLDVAGIVVMQLRAVAGLTTGRTWIGRLTRYCPGSDIREQPQSFMNCVILKQTTHAYIYWPFEFCLYSLFTNVTGASKLR